MTKLTLDDRAPYLCTLALFAGCAPLTDGAAPAGSSGDGTVDVGAVAASTPDHEVDDDAAALRACAQPVLAPGDTNRLLQLGSVTRTYVLHVPTSYTGTKRVPLVVDFHGLGGSGQAERRSSPYPAVLDPEGVIMAFPDGLPGPKGNAWNVGNCCVDNVDDVAFAKALVAQIETATCIDQKRVYAVGYSMGGGMSHYLGCHAADTFAAVAPAAFDLLQENVGGCNPRRPISEISFRSTGDPVVHYGGGHSTLVPDHAITFLGAVTTFHDWAAIDQCTGAPSAPDSNGCSTYSNCGAGVAVTLCTKQGGGHDFGNASQAWPFLKRHPMP